MRAQRHTYITATDPATKKSRCMTLHGFTPFKAVQLLKRIDRGELVVIEPSQEDDHDHQLISPMDQTRRRVVA